jgi:hypothetical protein
MAKAKKAKAKSGGDPLAPIKKNAFWIGLGLVVLIGLVCYFLGSSSVSKMRQENLNKIKSLDGAVAAAVPADAVSDPGRKEFVEKILKPRRDLEEGKWKSLYSAQATVFDWPPQVLQEGTGAVLQPGLPSNFIDAMKAMPPLEQLTPKHAIDDTLANIYRNYSRNHVPELCRHLKATNFLDQTVLTTTGTAIARAADKQAEETLKEGDLVLWSKRSQEATRDQFDFKATVPTVYDILAAQEDSWVYEAIFRAIADTNEPGAANKPADESTPATKPDPKTPAAKIADAQKVDAKSDKKADTKIAAKEAPAKRVEPVVKKVLEVKVGERYEPPAGSADRKRSTKQDDLAGGGQDQPQEEKLTLAWEVLAQKRYVDERGEPLTAAQVKALAAGQEYKRVPIHIRLEMDQRGLGDFFAACLRSPTKIQWRQLAFTTEPVYQRSKPLGAAEAATGQQAVDKTEKKGFFDMPVDLYGYVYVVNPPKLPPLQPAEAAADVATQEQPADDTAKPADAAKTNTETPKATP